MGPESAKDAGSENCSVRLGAAEAAAAARQSLQQQSDRRRSTNDVDSSRQQELRTSALGPLNVQGTTRATGIRLSRTGAHDPDALDTWVRNPALESPGHSGRHGYVVPWQQYAALCVWYALLLIEYCIVRGVCHLGAPDDCVEQYDKLDLMRDMEVLFTQGFMLAMLTGIVSPHRFKYLLCFHGPRPRGWAFIGIFLAAGPSWSLIDIVPNLKDFTLTPESILQGGLCSVLAVLTAVGAILLVGWHVVYAYKHNPFLGFLIYAISRLAIWGFLGLYILLCVQSDRAHFHVHHYIAGFMCASLAQFNHPISLVLLALASGVFVQGIAANGASPMIERIRMHGLQA